MLKTYFVDSGLPLPDLINQLQYALAVDGRLVKVFSSPESSGISRLIDYLPIPFTVLGERVDYLNACMKAPDSYIEQYRLYLHCSHFFVGSVMEPTQRSLFVQSLFSAFSTKYSLVRIGLPADVSIQPPCSVQEFKTVADFSESIRYVSEASAVPFSFENCCFRSIPFVFS